MFRIAICANHGQKSECNMSMDGESWNLLYLPFGNGAYGLIFSSIGRVEDPELFNIIVL